MKQFLLRLLFVICFAAPAAAQSKATADRGWLSFNAGTELAAPSFSNAVDTTVNLETEHVTTGYPARAGLLIAIDGGRHVWRRLFLGGGFYESGYRTTAAIAADIPHPFFFNEPRHVTGTASAGHTEVGISLLAGTSLQIHHRLHLRLTVGPSLVIVSQNVVTGIHYTDQFPFDTATFTGAMTEHPRAWGAGVTAGADAFWRLRRRVGVGALLQYTRAAATPTTTAGRVTIIAGGLQLGGGLRVFF